MSRLSARAWACYALALLVALCYHAWLRHVAAPPWVASRDGRYTALVQTDTETYGTFPLPDDLAAGVLQYPNVLGPALLTQTLAPWPWAPLVCNAALLASAIVLFLRLQRRLGIRSPWPVALFVLLPDTGYYLHSIGKELPSVVLLLAWLLALLRRQPGALGVWLLLAVAVRWQLAGLLALLTGVLWGAGPPARRVLLGGFGTMCVLLPWIYGHLPFVVSTATALAVQAPGTGAGSFVVQRLQTVPGIGVIVLPLRALQALAEPLLSLPPWRAAALDVYGVVALVSAALLLPVVLGTLGALGTLLRRQRPLSPTAQRVLWVVMAYALGNAALLLVARRYLYPIVPLVLLGAWLRPWSRRRGLLVGATSAALGALGSAWLWWASV